MVSQRSKDVNHRLDRIFFYFKHLRHDRNRNISALFQSPRLPLRCLVPWSISTLAAIWSCCIHVKIQSHPLKDRKYADIMALLYSSMRSPLPHRYAVGPWPGILINTEISHPHWIQEGNRFFSTVWWGVSNKRIFEIVLCAGFLLRSALLCSLLLVKFEKVRAVNLNIHAQRLFLAPSPHTIQFPPFTSSLYRSFSLWHWTIQNSPWTENFSLEILIYAVFWCS
jgi:hypothetical protein